MTFSAPALAPPWPYFGQFFVIIFLNYNHANASSRAPYRIPIFNAYPLYSNPSTSQCNHFTRNDQTKCVCFCNSPCFYHCNLLLIYIKLFLASLWCYVCFIYILCYCITMWCIVSAYCDILLLTIASSIGILLLGICKCIKDQ